MGYCVGRGCFGDTGSGSVKRVATRLLEDVGTNVNDITVNEGMFCAIPYCVGEYSYMGRP